MEAGGLSLGGGEKITQNRASRGRPVVGRWWCGGGVPPAAGFPQRRFSCTTLRHWKLRVLGNIMDSKNIMGYAPLGPCRFFFFNFLYRVFFRYQKRKNYRSQKKEKLSTTFILEKKIDKK
jgi:hypothetical protein